VDLNNFVRWQFGSSVIINFEYDLVGGNGTHHSKTTVFWQAIIM
jgi:hypothetical protein